MDVQTAKSICQFDHY